MAGLVLDESLSYARRTNSNEGKMEPEKRNQTEETEERPLTAQELEKRYRWELFKFVTVMALITSIALGNMFYRQQPLIKIREYDFQSTFVFRNIYHEGELTFKACFKKELYGGYYVCFKFPPSKRKLIESGDFTPEDFAEMFVDPVYMDKFLARFYETQGKIGHEFLGFRINYTRRDLSVSPVYDLKKTTQRLDPSLAAKLR